MVTMDANLAELHLQRAISFETGVARSVDAKEFERLVTTGGLAAEEGGAHTRVPVRATEGVRGGPPAIGRSGRAV
jgi:twitching motility protein PilT